MYIGVLFGNGFFTEGKTLATKRHCKFIEVSALLNHKMDELLVGTLRQIRLRQTTSTAAANAARLPPPPTTNHQQYHPRHQQQQQHMSMSANDTAAGEATPLLGLGCLQRAAAAVFGKLFQRSVVRSTSCDDLFKP